MAEIETLIGVTKVNAFEYEVISEVSVGSGIDDLEYATFVQKSGGLLKFDNGCTTTFTNCKFVEETSAASAPGNKRFIANSSTAPVFKGCKFIIDHGSNGNGRGASDFDVSTGTSPTFDFSEDGSPCYFIRNNGGTSEAKANHYRSGTFNSFVVDQNGGGGAFEIMHPALTINDLTLKGRGYSNPLSSRHLIVYTSASQFHNNTTTFRKLKADNVSLFAGTNKNDNNVIIQVIDAKGQLLRAEDTPNSQRGHLQFLRTYQSAPLDATTLSATEVKCYLKNTDNSDIIIDGLTSGVDEGLLQYKYEHNATTTKGVITYDANDDPQTTGTFFTVANNYIRGFISYDRLPTSRTFKIEDRNDGSPLVHDVVLVDDSAITDTRVTTDAYQEIDTPQKFYNRAKAYLVDNYAGEAETLVSRDGNTINAGSYDVVIDGNVTDAASAFAISGNTLTIKATRFVGNIATSGSTTLSNGAEVIGTFGATTVLPWVVKNVEATSRFQLYNITKGAEVVTQKLTGIAYNKAILLELYGHTYAVTLKHGGAFIDATSLEVIASGSASSSWTLQSGVVQFNVGSGVLGSALTQDDADINVDLIQGHEDNTVTATATINSSEFDDEPIANNNGNIDVSGSYNASEIAVNDIIRLRVTCVVGAEAMIPLVTTGVATTAGLNFSIEQQADTVYNTNAIDGSSINAWTADFTNTPMGVDLSESDGGASVQEIYAYIVYQQTTADGVDKWFNVVTAIDGSNYQIDQAIADIKIQNIGTVAVNISGGRIFRKDGASVLYAEDGNKPLTLDTGALVANIQPQIEAAINNNAKISSTNNNSKLIPGLL